MKKWWILVFGFLFHNISNLNIIKNYEEISFLEGKTEFKYEFTEPILKEEKDVYFFFKFSSDFFIDLTIIDEDNNKETIDVRQSNKYLIYKISNLKSQIYTFSINNRGWSYGQTMRFIDNSKEISTNLDDFLGFSLKTDNIYNTPPLPLIFNIDSIEEKLILSINKESYTESILEVCKISENQCNFKGNMSQIIFEKDKKYKIKYNYLYNGNYYYFKAYTKSIYKEIGIGLNKFSYYKTTLCYIIVDITKYNNFYIYISYNNEYRFYYSFISEKEKNSFLNDLDVSISFDSKDTQKIINMEKEKDYIIIKLESSYSEYINGYIVSFNSYIDIQYDTIFEVEKGTIGILRKERIWDCDNKYFLVSSKSNMVIFSSILKEDFTNLITIDCDNYDDTLIFFDSSKEKTTFNYYAYQSKNVHNFPININFIKDSNLAYYFNKYDSDSLFIRTTFNLIDFNYNCSYFFGIEDKYYLYIKKYYGNFDFYKYNKELDIFSNITLFLRTYHLYQNLEDYEIINNKLIIISGFQLITFFNSYDSLYDLYFQKANDLEHIIINKKMFPYNNLVKLFNENKKYYLDFEVEHLIKLDKDFLDAEVTFIDSNNTTYILNKDNKIIKDLKGKGIIVKTTKKALIYFYKKMDNITELGMIEFDKSQKGKIMKFNITSKNKISIKIAKDFGFKGYYPMINEENYDIITPRDNIANIYIENLYDKLNDLIYEKEGEKFYIYIFDSENDNLPILNYENYIIGEVEYIDNILTPNNKLNLEIISSNSNGLILLDVINKLKISYQFITCKNKEINFTIENFNGYFPYYGYGDYPYRETIKESDEIIRILYNYKDKLIHSFESDEEFVFTYSLMSNDYNGYHSINGDFSIEDVYVISNDIIQVKFTINYGECLNQYFIIVANKDENNNIESFSNPCYLSKLLIQNSTDSYVIKSFYSEKNIDLVIANIDIHNLNINENSELVINIIIYNSIIYKKYFFYNPLEFKYQLSNYIEFKFGDEVIFNLANKKAFKFEYNLYNEMPQDIYFYFDTYYHMTLFFTEYTNTIMVEFDLNDKILKITLKKSGTHYLELYSNYIDNHDYKFTTFTTGKIIDTIDLTKKMYYENSKIISGKKLEPNLYKVKNIKKNTVVYFNFNVPNKKERKEYYNPFEICKENNNECYNNITYFKFLKGNEYSIYINFINSTTREWYENENEYPYP